MTETEERAAVVAEAISWYGTPYHSHARVKGRYGGVDCLTFIVEVYERVGIIPRQELPHYEHQWHLSRHEELYIAAIEKFCHEIPGPPQPGDLVMYKVAKCFSHCVIVIKWPKVVHAYFGRVVMPTNAEQDSTLIGRPRKFYSLWPRQ